MPRSDVRHMHVDALRAELDRLETTRVQNDDTYKRYVAIQNEIERRGLKRFGRPPAVISKGATKLMKAADLRAKYEELLAKEARTVAESNTLRFLGEEMERRRKHAKATYDRRKSQVQAFIEVELQ